MRDHRSAGRVREDARDRLGVVGAQAQQRFQHVLLHPHQRKARGRSEALLGLGTQERRAGVDDLLQELGVPQMGPLQQPQDPLAGAPYLCVVHIVADLAHPLHQVALHPVTFTKVCAGRREQFRDVLPPVHGPHIVLGLLQHRSYPFAVHQGQLQLSAALSSARPHRVAGVVARSTAWSRRPNPSSSSRRDKVTLL